MLWKWMGLFSRKNSLLRCWGRLNRIGVLTLSLLLKLSPREMEPWFGLFSPEVALYLYKSSIWSCLGYCCHVWDGAPSCYLELLDKPQKRICRTVGPSRSTFLEPLACPQNVASLSLFYRYYFSKCSSELAQLVPLPFSRGRSTCYSDTLHCMIFLSQFLDVTRMSMLTVSFLTQLWKSLPTECFPLTFDPNGFKSRIKHL